MEDGGEAVAPVSFLHNVLAQKRRLGWQGAVRYAVNWLALRAMEAEGRSFDARRGVDTAGVVEKTDSVYSAVSLATLGKYYRAVSPAHTPKAGWPWCVRLPRSCR